MTNYRSLNHSKWACQYHVVFIPKYRKKAIYGSLRRHLGWVLRELARQRESEVEEGHLLADHVHMMVSIPPKYAVAQVIGYIKGKSAIHIAREFAGPTGGQLESALGARSPVSTERFGPKILLHRQLTNFGVELLGLLLGMLSLDRTGAEHMLGIRHQLLLPVLDLIRMHLELLGEIGQGTLSSDCGQRDLGFKHW